MHHPCLDKTIPGHETVQTMEINITQRKYKEKCKKAAQPTSKQDGQFMAIHAAQAKQDMNHKTSSCPKCHSLHLKKGRTSQIKQAQNVHAPSVSWQNHTWAWDCANNGNQYNANKIQRKYKKGSSTYLKTRWTIHGNSPSTGRTGHGPRQHVLAQAATPCIWKKAEKGRSNKHKTCMHYLCFDKTIPGHETLQTMEVNIMQKIQRKMQKGSSTYLKIRWTFHGNSHGTGRTGHRPREHVLAQTATPHV